MNKGLTLLFALLVTASILFIAFLGRSVVSDLTALSTAKHDDVSWNMSQLEVELLNLQNALPQVARSDTDELSTFRRRYDIFYSRVGMLSQSELFRDLLDSEVAASDMVAITDFLETSTPLVDGPDDALHSGLPDMAEKMSQLRPLVRDLALVGVQTFAAQDAARRAQLSKTLTQLAVCVLALVAILVLVAAFLIRQILHSQRISHENMVMRARFEAAVTSSLDAVLVVDTNGRIVEFNGAAETVFGYARNEAIGANMATLIVPEHLREAHDAGMKRFLETGEKKVIGAGRVRLEGLRKSGQVFPVELSISLSEADGERVFVSFLRDITHELEVEEAMRTARDHAQESEKAKSNLLTVMSHEMRTPLNGIMGSLALIDQDNLDARQKRHLNSIAISGRLLLSHVNDVLDLSSLSSDTSPREREAFDLCELVESLVDTMLDSSEARDNEMSTEFLSQNLSEVVGDKKSLQQCLVNLVGNAIKFTKNGTVGIEVERLGSSDEVQFRVSDTGVGISPENLERIFEEFVTIDTTFARENAGTGLGLAITKRLIEAMDGSVDAESVPGEGSLFTFTIPLPVANTHPVGSPEGQKEIRPEIPQGTRVLVVDDNEINRLVLADMLQDIGVETTQAVDGFKAIEKLSQQEFDAVVLDISMPGIDGIETLKRIRELAVPWSDLPAIAVTAHATKEDHALIRRAPFTELIVKPINAEQLTVSLGSALSVEPAPDRNFAVPIHESEYRTRFGEEKYLSAMQGFRQDLDGLLSVIDHGATPGDDFRREAHRLAGSAAVLGETKVWEHLQSLETTTDDGELGEHVKVLKNLAATLSVGKGKPRLNR